MSHCILWIDQSQAKEFVFAKNFSRSKLTLHKPKPERHEQHLDRIDTIKKEDLKHFFEEVAGKLSKTEGLLIAGPGLAKTHFHSHLETHYPSIAKKVLGEIVMDQSTDSEILSAAKNYLHEHRLDKKHQAKVKRILGKKNKS
ncbi:eRF1 domain 2 [Leptospira alstonii]|uniref:eRF1 domain 2 n=1 Tax=Leptospira alstonii TaxID=28452 RepID=UPI0007746CD7|nr:eRF1 domain 2 [Leptospira alstonii]